MVRRKTHRRKHRQNGGGCGCGGSSILGFPQAGGQMNSIIGSPNNSMNSMNSMNSAPLNTGMNSMNSAPLNTGMNSMNSASMNSAPLNTGMNSTRVNNRNLNSSMSYNNSSTKSNSPFLSMSNMQGGFLGMFESKNPNVTGVETPQSVVNIPGMNNRVSDSSRLQEIERRLQKLETGGGFFGGRRRKHRTRKHKSRK